MKVVFILATYLFSQTLLQALEKSASTGECASPPNGGIYPNLLALRAVGPLCVNANNPKTDYFTSEGPWDWTCGEKSCRAETSALCTSGCVYLHPHAWTVNGFNCVESLAPPWRSCLSTGAKTKTSADVDNFYGDIEVVCDPKTHNIVESKATCRPGPRPQLKK